MQQTRIIWLAMLMSFGFYFIIAFVAVPVAETDPFQNDSLVAVLYILAAVTFVAAFLVSSMIMRRDPSPERTRLGYIVRWAMIEATAIYGLIAAFLRQDRRLFLPLGILAVIGMLISYPRGRSDHMR
jgi:F0F1-type ATP synthase membrane subunit c/vacuolar-type H+-ATPase subunit K